MKGSIIERGNALRLKVCLGKNETTGKYDSFYETFHGSREKANQRLRELLTELDKGTFIKPGKATLGEYLQAWLADSIKPNRAENTAKLYSYICNRHILPSIGKCKLVELKPQQIQHLYAEKQSSGLGNRTVQLIHVVLHTALANACKMILVTRNVANYVEKPQSPRPAKHTMNEVDINKFLEAAKDGEYYNLFFCYLFTGMRRSELLATRWSDVDLLGMQVSVSRSMQYLNKVKEHISFKQPKTEGSRRVIDLSPSNVMVLRQQREYQERIRQSFNLPALTDSDLVFSHYDGSPLLPDSITHAWMKLVRKCDLRGVRLHDARHTMATIMFKQGVHPKIVQERLGHSSISLTWDTYSDSVPGLQQRADYNFDSILNKETKLDKELKNIIQN
jgi:integrase